MTRRTIQLQSHSYMVNPSMSGSFVCSKARCRIAPIFLTWYQNPEWLTLCLVEWWRKHFVFGCWVWHTLVVEEDCIWDWTKLSSYNFCNGLWLVEHNLTSGKIWLVGYFPFTTGFQFQVKTTGAFYNSGLRWDLQYSWNVWCEMSGVDPDMLQTALLQVAEATKAASDAAKLSDSGVDCSSLSISHLCLNLHQ